MAKNKYNTIDLFAGCGGLMDGFEQEGHYKTLACVEWEKAPCETLIKRLYTKWKHTNASNEVIRFDIQRTEELLNGYDDPTYGTHCGLNKLVKNKKIDVIIGGPPCQAYSLAGRIRDEHGMRDDYRNYLFESYIRIVEHFKPSYFIFENVVGMLSAAPDGTPIVNKIYEAFRAAGYFVTMDFTNALFDVADFGIPQHRKRVIILGIRQEELVSETDPTGEVAAQKMIDSFYNDIMPSFKTKIRTVADAIGDLPKLYPSKEIIRQNRCKYSHTPIESEGFLNHSPRFHSERDIKVFRLLAEDIQSKRFEYTSTERLKELYTSITGAQSNVHKYYVLRWNEPSNTIPAHLYKDGLRHIHPDPEQARSITVREAARLQTFQDDFEFLGSSGDQYKMIGNAVPTAFAKIIAKALYKLMAKS